MPKNITTALKQFDAEGSFSSRRTSNAEDLHIEINSIGSLRFPLKSSVVKRMIKIAKPATFGWRDKTCQDSEVRNVWKIPKSRIKLDKRRWNKTLNPTVDRFKDELGLPEQSRLQAELHEMLIYAPGQFFQFHQDSEKCDGMVATLVVVLPSPHSGGTLVIDHQGEQRRYQSSRTAADKLTCFAFYADCQHEVRPVTEGYRVALIYNLVLKGETDCRIYASASNSQQQLTETLDSYFSGSPQEDENHGRAKKLIYLLDHQYTPKGLSWKALKNIDRLRASALSEVAATLGLEIFLTLADIQEIWNCEIDGSGWDYGSRRRYCDYCDDDELEEESDDDANLELLELIDDATIIKYWRDAAGKAADLPEWPAHGAGFCWTKATDEFSPFESEYEGWMGNYGNTMERWYHRAAIVLWRMEDRHAVLLEIAPEMMIRELCQLAEKKKTRQQAQDSVRRLLPHWVDSGYSRRELSSYAPILKLALNIDDAGLVQRLLQPLSIEALQPKYVQAMTRLQAAYGTPWLTAVIQGWQEAPTYERWGNLIPKLPSVIEHWVTQAPDEHRELTHWLLGRQFNALKQKHLDHAQNDSPVSHAKNASTRVAEITDLLSAALLSSDNEVLHAMIDHLIANEKSYLLTDLVEVTRFVKGQNHGLEAPERHSAWLLKFVRSRLTEVLNSPPRAAGDWSITDKVTCNCADCKDLAVFLQSSFQEHKVWPLAKRRRQHIHQVIDGMGIPVTHTTERRGSPHKLHLTKTKQLFMQEKAVRAQFKEALEDLAK